MTECTMCGQGSRTLYGTIPKDHGAPQPDFVSAHRLQRSISSSLPPPNSNHKPAPTWRALLALPVSLQPVSSSAAPRLTHTPLMEHCSAQSTALTRPLCTCSWLYTRARLIYAASIDALHVLCTSRRHGGSGLGGSY